MSEASELQFDMDLDPDLSGRRLGDYQLLRRLGRGGMADVYLAEQTSLARNVAFKVLKGSLAKSQAYVRRFQNEARAAASLVHANIVQIYEVGCIEGHHFIAQEYVAGQNLRQILRRGGFNAKLAVSVMKQVAAALQRAAEAGIIHRDIKPENIMLSPSGEVKVADFGLARLTRTDSGLDLTQVGITLGTPLYMSPEQVEGKPLSPSSDIYSLGVTCYHMLAGRTPFDGDNALAVAVQHLKAEPERLENLRRDLPEGLCRIVHRMLEKEPAKRFASGAELLRELRALPLPHANSQSSADLQLLSLEDLPQLAETRLAATQRLESLMKTQTVRIRRRVHRGWFLLAGLLAFFGGGLLAWATRPPSLLKVNIDELPQIARQADARAQYWHAIELGTERGWQAVAEYFPPDASPVNELYSKRARQHLAEYYLDHGELERARTLYQELSEDTTDVQFQAAGLIGQANVYAARNEISQAKSRLALVIPLVPQLQRLNPTMALDLEQRLDTRLRVAFRELRQEMSENGGAKDRG